MPVIYLTGGDGSEQAMGPTLDANRSRVMAVNTRNPLNLYDLGGHRIPDAPEYDVIEAKSFNRYVAYDGLNTVETEELVGEQIRGTSYTLDLPHPIMTQAHRIRQLQGNGNEFDFIIMPTAPCADECDEYFRLMRNTKMGAIRDTSSPVNYGEDANAVTRQTTINAKGAPLTYLGLQSRVLKTGLGDIIAITELQGLCDDSGGCPWQSWAIGGAAGYLAKTSNQFGSLTQITTTTVTTDVASAIITDIVELPSGTLVFTYSDVSKAVATAGGVAYSADGGAAVLSTLSVADTGLNALVYANSKLYAFGSGGKIYVSSDEGLNFTAITSPTSEVITAAVFDPSTSLIYFVATGPELWSFDGSSFVNLTAFVGASASSDFLSIDTLGPDALIIGGSDGFVHQTFNASSSSPDFVSSALSGNSVRAVAGDIYRGRSVAGSGAVWYKRDHSTRGSWKKRDTLTAAILSAAAGSAQSEEGTNYYILGTDDGKIVELASCFPCSVS